MIRFASKKTLVAVIVAAALMVFLVPAFVAYRYTAPAERGQFVTHPWRGWGFVWAALAVPGDSELKTSGMALRKADWRFEGTAVDPREVQLLFVPKGRPYTFTNVIDGRTVTNTVVPRYRFIWQVQGVVDTVPRRSDTIVALFDYATGAVLYDVRDDLRPADLVPEPTSTPRPLGSPQTELSPSASPAPSGSP